MLRSSTASRPCAPLGTDLPRRSRRPARSHHARPRAGGVSRADSWLGLSCRCGVFGPPRGGEVGAGGGSVVGVGRAGGGSLAGVVAAVAVVAATGEAG